MYYSPTAYFGYSEDYGLKIGYDKDDKPCELIIEPSEDFLRRCYQLHELQKLKYDRMCYLMSWFHFR